MKVSSNYLAQQFDAPLTAAILDDLRALVQTGDFTMGAPMREFERRFSALVGGRTIIAVNSGTDALILALKAAGVGPHDRVLVPANGFYATSGAVVAAGATPVFVDVDETMTMDPACADAAPARAILPVWWTGAAPDWEPLLAVASRTTMRVIEDACPAIGGSYAGRPAGTFGETAAFSFHPIKTLHCWGDGGAVAVPTHTIAGGRRDAWLARYRNHGMVARDRIDVWGVNARLHTTQAVVLLRLLDAIAPAQARRQQIADRYDTALANVVQLPPRDPRRVSSWRLYVVQTERRDALVAALAHDGIEGLVHYPTPMHLQPPARALGYQEGMCPVAERQATRIVSLPCHEFMEDGQVAYVIERVRAFYGR